ncbi:MAG: hypothetical protein COB15_06225 [Flavobacteriales bacterium]|nr:MAG: hypothetical protein COB15_06225 [Flavobacteriales bacterium]
MNRIINITLAGLLLIGCSATPEQLNRKEYVKWMTNPANGLIVNKAIDQYQLEVQYRPSTLIALQENYTISAENLKERSKILDNSLNFNFKIKANNPALKVMDIGNQTEQDYFLKLDYFTNGIQQDLKLIDGTDTLNCMFSVFERTYDLAPYVTFNLAFENTVSIQNDQTIYFDGSKLGLGPVYLNISKEKIKNIPTLILN